MTFAPGPAVDNYEFLSIIDKPKAGVTYKVRNLTTGEFETLRTLPGASYGDPESLERFLREIRVHTRLSHPNIIAFHDAFELDGQLVMTAEFVEGATLAELCRKGRLLSPEAARVICEILAALEEAHGLGIVHRGITAEHVIVTPAGEVKLGGFGLAKPASDMNLTQSGAVLGDPRYISPEQVLGTNALDGRADLYSVGVLLYQALTGKVPFSNPNDFDVMVAQVSTPPRPPSLLNPGISPALEQVVLTALAKKTEQRYADAIAFRTALASVTSAAEAPPEKPIETPAPDYIPPQFLVESQPGPSNRNAFAAGAAAVAALLIAVYYLLAH